MSDEYNNEDADLHIRDKITAANKLRECAELRQCRRAQELLARAAIPLSQLIEKSSYTYNSQLEYWAGAISDDIKRSTGQRAIRFCEYECALKQDHSDT